MLRILITSLLLAVSAAGGAAAQNADGTTPVAGFWTAVDSAAGIRVELNTYRNSDGRVSAHVAYFNAASGQLVCRTPAVFQSHSGVAMAFREVRCGRELVQLMYYVNEVYFERLNQSRSGPLQSDVAVDLPYGGPPRPVASQ